MPESARQTSRGAQSRPGRPAGHAPARPSVAQRRIRAALLLAAVAWLPVSIVLTVTGVLMWISIPFAVLTVGAVLVWLRAEAPADRLRTSAGTDESFQSRDVAYRVPMLSSEDTQVIRSAAAPAEAPAVASS